MLFTFIRNILRGSRTIPAGSPGRRGDADVAPPEALEGGELPGELLKRAAKLHGSGDLAAASRLYGEVLRAAPDNADAHHLLGMLELYRGNHADAVASIRRAVALDPQNAAYLEHLALALEWQGDFGEAAERRTQLLAMNPSDAEAHSGMGNLLLAARRADEAAASYRRAIELTPESARFQFNLSMALLLRGAYEEGWRQYEFRWDGSPEAAGRRRDFACPQWHGEPLAGRTLLLHAEQAFGDTLQFVRYAGPVADRGDAGRVLLECQPELTRLFSGMHPRIEVLRREAPLPPFDVHCPLASLPLAFGTTVEAIPREVPYLYADAPATERWAQRLGARDALRVGLVWSGKARRMNRWHNLELADLAPLIETPGVRCFSLQKAQDGSTVKSVTGALPLEDHTPELNDFADTAALIANLDLVISVDTSVAHLAGALGVPVWLLARYDADWRWLLDRPDSPWYPTMRIFRQDAPGDWRAPMREVIAALREKIRR